MRVFFGMDITGRDRSAPHLPSPQPPMPRPWTTVVLAMSADGKIADQTRSPARFGSPADKRHLEERIAECDAVLFGAGTLRAYGTTLPIRSEELLQQRQRDRRPPQPIHMVCSASGNLAPDLPFFQQPVPRWLLTTGAGRDRWQHQPHFDRILTSPAGTTFDWIAILQDLPHQGIERLAILGGGELVGSLLAADVLDELYLTVCPLLLGGSDAPSPIAGLGFPAAIAPRLQLRSAQVLQDEVFLQYRICPTQIPLNSA